MGQTIDLYAKVATTGLFAVLSLLGLFGFVSFALNPSIDGLATVIMSLLLIVISVGLMLFSFVFSE